MYALRQNLAQWTQCADMEMEPIGQRAASGDGHRSG
jgi:hypothetical protein